MGITPLRDDQILMGKSSGDAIDTQSITSVSSDFAGNAPLWAYSLAEVTEHAYPVANGKIIGAQRATYRLGAVGGRIVTETIIGLIKSDPSSILNSSSPTPRYSFRSLVNEVANGAVLTPTPRGIITSVPQKRHN